LEYGNDVDYMVANNGILLSFFISQKKNKESEKESPLDILKRRYANGELTTVEYEERKKVLEGI